MRMEQSGSAIGKKGCIIYTSMQQWIVLPGGIFIIRKMVFQATETTHYSALETTLFFQRNTDFSNLIIVLGKWNSPRNGINFLTPFQVICDCTKPKTEMYGVFRAGLLVWQRKKRIILTQWIHCLTESSNRN